MDATGPPAPIDRTLRPVKVFISYSHDSLEHKDRVLALSDRLRSQGVDCEIDQYEANPVEGWPAWCKRKIKESDFTLCVCTQVYFDRYEGNEAPGHGGGVKYEGFVILQSFYAAESKNTKFIPISFTGDWDHLIPMELTGASRFQLDTADGYEALYRLLTDQPCTLKPALGSRLDLPPTAHQPANMGAEFPLAGPALPARERKQRFTPWLVPHSYNPYFTGRVAELNAVDAVLKSGGRAAISQVQAISGLGGVGKTQTAVRYCYDHRDDYAAVFWLLAESPETLTADAMAVARELHLPEANAQEQDRAMQAVCRWLRDNTNWLLVFDNVDTPEMVAACRKFLPTDASGAVLVTSRLDDMAELGVATPVDMPTLPPDEALVFLRKRCRREELSSTEEQAANDLAEALGYLPLALEQAAAYIVATKSTFAEYLEAYRSAGLKLLQKGRVKAGDYKYTVGTTWALSIERVRAECPAAVELLNICSLLAPTPIPLALIRDGGKEMGAVVADFLAEAGELGPKELLSPLLRYSLFNFKVDKNAFSMHRLVQLAAIDNFQGDYINSIIKRTVNVLIAIFPLALYKLWELCDKYIAHVLSCAYWVKFYHTYKLGIGALLLFNEGATYLWQRAQYVNSEMIIRIALRLGENSFGPTSIALAPIYCNLAEILLVQNKCKDAELYCRRAIEIREKEGETSSVKFAINYSTLARICWAQGRLSSSEKYYRNALDMLANCVGSEHVDFATCCNNLAALFCARGDYPSAEPLFYRALRIRERLLNGEHPDIANSCHNLAGVARKKGAYKDAEIFWRRALAIREKNLGDVHPDTIVTLEDFADFLQKNGSEQEAQQLFIRAKAGRKALEALNAPRGDDA